MCQAIIIVDQISIQRQRTIAQCVLFSVKVIFNENSADPIAAPIKSFVYGIWKDANGGTFIRPTLQPNKPKSFCFVIHFVHRSVLCRKAVAVCARAVT